MSDELSGKVSLREVQVEDIPIFFLQQLDPEAIQMAAFTPKDPPNWEFFQRRWEHILLEETIVKRTILLNDQVAGHILSFPQAGQIETGYWLGREFWGRGIATQALAQFLQIQTHRPLYARAAQDNTGSLRVLQKCGFVIQGEERGYANARKDEIDEYILILGLTSEQE